MPSVLGKETHTHTPFFSGPQVLNLIRHLCYLILESLKVREEKGENKASDDKHGSQAHVLIFRNEGWKGINLLQS